jgi:hypothetical protein
MPYSINKYDGTLVAVVEDGTVDNSLDIKLIGRNYAGYGEVQNENMVHILENFASTSEPPRKITGQIWFDSANKKLKFYDGIKFRTTGGAEIGATQPSGLTTGDFWYNTNTNQLFAWAGSEFVLVGPQAVQNAQTTELRSTSVLDVDSTARPVIEGVVNGKIVFIISNTEFTLSTNPDNTVNGFTVIKKGLTLVDTGTNGVTTSDYRYWGTASNAAKLNGFGDTDFVKAANSSFSNLVRFLDPGFTVGNNDDLKVYIDNAAPVIKNQTADAPIVFKTTVNVQGGNTVERTPLKIQGTVLLPGSDSINIGSSAEKFNTVYAQVFTGQLDGTANRADTFNVGGSYLQGSLSATVNTVAARDSSGDITANRFVGLATRAANINGGTANAIPYQTAANTTALLSPGSADQVLAINDSGNLDWVDLTSLVNTGQATQIGVTNTQITNTTHYVTFTSGITGFQDLKVDSNALTYNPNSNTLTTGIFSGIATFAQYGDLAEKYLPDADYEVGTVLMIGGDQEVTAAQAGFRAIGVVSEKPAYLMNSELEGGVAVALKGRVPVKVTGAVIKGQRLVASSNGVAHASFSSHIDVFAIALETNTDAGVKLIECIVL